MSIQELVFKELRASSFSVEKLLLLAMNVLQVKGESQFVMIVVAS